MGHCNFHITTPIHLTSCPLSPSLDDFCRQESNMSHNTSVLARVGKDLCMLFLTVNCWLLVISTNYDFGWFCLLWKNFGRNHAWILNWIKKTPDETTCLIVFTKPMATFTLTEHWNHLWIKCFWPLWPWPRNSSEWILVKRLKTWLDS